ncbi:HEAT repeat domain-containing protein [Actinomadura sp. BRA 177]|uniref:HEAT repeat domain-containing protein n=1 Tax=Actinomadura sp. BRA 177 TaxID=2745202 RepID=UPI001595B2FF|nr:HEAT repeat domain-containing protein [Actinomadura sp. BRA 177]
MLPDLQDALRTAIPEAPEAAALWLADPARREARAVELLAADASSIALPEVWRVVTGRRTDLLRSALDGKPTEWVPDIAPQEPGRWTPPQADHVRAVLAGPATAASLGRLPGALDVLVSWAGREDEPVLAEAALEAMGAADRPAEALDVLLAHARGPGSAVAVAAMARCSASVPPSRLGPLLAEALTGPRIKVTVRKQAARLLERLRPPRAADVLLRAWNDPGLHQDVRVAVASALRRMPEDPRAIPALTDAADLYASELMLRTLFQAKPSEYAPEHRPAYAALVRRLGRAADDPGIRFRAAKAFGAWVPWYADGFGDILAAVADPADPAGDDELPILRALLWKGVVGDEVLDVLASLLAAEPGDVARSRAVAVADWPGEWRSLLVGLRRSAHVEVSQAAWDIRLPVTR